MFATRELRTTSYAEALEEHIFKVICDAVDGRLLESELHETLGNHKQITDKIAEMEYRNIIRRLPVTTGDVKDSVLYVPTHELSVWTTMKAMPCFTCDSIEICKIGNSSNSVDCTLFNNWVLDKYEI